MTDGDKSRKELIKELAEARRYIARLEASEAGRILTEAALQESEARYRRLFDSAPDSVTVVDTKGIIIEWSQSGEQLYGYSQEEIIGKHIAGLMPPSSVAVFQEKFPQLQQLESTEGEIQIVRRDGDIVKIWRKGIPLTDAGGNFAGILVHDRDITKRVRAEEELQKHRDHLEELVKERTLDLAAANKQLQQEIAERAQAEETLQQRNHELELLNRAGQAFNSTLDQGEVLATVLEEARHLLKVTACSVWLLDPETEEMVCRQVTNPQSEIVRGWRLAPGQGLVGWVSGKGQSLIVADVRSDERHFNGVDEQTGLPLRAILTVPLKVEQNVIGVIQAVDIVAGRFKASDLRLLEPLAEAAVAAIKNARLYGELKESREYAQNIIDSSLDTIISVDLDRKIVEFNRAAQETFGYRPEEVIGKSIDILYADPQEGLGIHNITLEEGRCVQEVLSRRKDGARFPGLLSASVLRDAGGKAAGMMGVSRDITEHVQAEEERERLLAAEREQRLLAETLREVTLALTAQIDHQAVLDEILRQAQRLVPYSTASIMLLEAARNTLRIACWQGYEKFGSEELISNLLQPLEDFPLEKEAVQSKKPVVVPDTHQESRWVWYKEAHWLRSYLTVPICLHNRVLGLLRLDSDIPGEFSPADAERLQPLTNAAAIALENARLYEQARQDAKTKTLLLEEVNHRVKNNLTAIIGMLLIEQRHTQQLQDRRDYLSIMDDLINRIKGLATVHQLLSITMWSPLLLSKLARQVIAAALQSLPPDREVLINIPMAASVYVTPKQAHNLAIVINELATNVAKHAAPSPEQAAQITVRITLDDGIIIFEFRDNGPGFPAEVLHSERQNVGLYLIRNATRHNLRGEIRLHNDEGAVAILRFANEVE